MVAHLQGRQVSQRFLRTGRNVTTPGDNGDTAKNLNIPLPITNDSSGSNDVKPFHVLELHPCLELTKLKGERSFKHFKIHYVLSLPPLQPNKS